MLMNRWKRRPFRRERTRGKHRGEGVCFAILTKVDLGGGESPVAIEKQ